MNYLGHLYFSNNDLHLMYANLFGDFVKGKNLSMYSSKVQKGIVLHRTIDSYIDHHPAVIELMHKLYESLPKITGIAIDLFFDHLLAKNWKTFHSLPLDDFITKFDNYNVNESEFPNTQFWFVVNKMKSEKWLTNYKSMDGLSHACNGLSKRISFKNKLSESPIIFNQFEDEITRTFFLFMEDAKSYFNEYFA